MIYSEYINALPFYDSIENQNRYRANCVNMANFTLLCPVNRILPFQIIVDFVGTLNVTSWKMYSSIDDSLAYNLTTYIGTYLDIKSDLTVFGNSFISYDGTTIAFQDFDCGKYYYEVIYNDGTLSNTVYSEIFTIDNFNNDTSFTQSDFDLYNAWPFRSVYDLLNHNLRQCKNLVDYKLICGNDALLPFQFRIPTGGAQSIDVWKLVGADDCCDTESEYVLNNEYIVDGNSFTHVNIATIGDYDYVTYIADIVFEDELPCGVYYCALVIDGIEYRSEIIRIVSNTDTISETNYLLQENGSKILQESGFGILLE